MPEKKCCKKCLKRKLLQKIPEKKIIANKARNSVKMQKIATLFSIGSKLETELN